MSKRKRHRGGQPGPKPLKYSEIPVIDPGGDEAIVYEREFRDRIPSTKLVRRFLVYELSSGERVEELDKDTFMLARTGDRFVRISKQTRS